jgi:hypothetical protein
MERECRTITVLIADGEAESEAFELAWAAGAGLQAPAALDATTVIAFKVSDDLDGNYLALYDDTNALVEVTVQVDAARAYALPEEVFAWPYVKLWAEASGTDVEQSADRTFKVSLKS